MEERRVATGLIILVSSGSLSLFPEDKLRELINLAHEYDVYVSAVSGTLLSFSHREMKYPRTT
jgi:phosphosulfolactate synthase (CoM biosynthesis protein A)